MLHFELETATYKTDGTRINVPTNKSGNGKNFIDLKDSDGVYMVRELIEAAKKGGAFVAYRFDKPGAGVQPKLAYARMIPGTDVVIGTGVYIDSVEAERTRVANLVSERNDHYDHLELLICTVVLALILPLASCLFRNTSGAGSIVIIFFYCSIFNFVLQCRRRAGPTWQKNPLCIAPLSREEGI